MDTVEQRIVDNVIGALRVHTRFYGVAEGEVPADPRQQALPFCWVSFEPVERVAHGGKHDRHTMRASAVAVYEAAAEPDGLRIARTIRGFMEAALLVDRRRGLTNPTTEFEPHAVATSGDGLWAVELPMLVTFNHRIGNPFDEGA